MGPDPKILDDIARVAGGAVNIVSGMQEQLREEVKSRVEDAAFRMELVPREDFDQLQDMVSSLSQKVTDLEKQIDSLATKKTTKSK